MKYTALLLLLFLMITYSKNSKAQDLSNHEWKDRLVLVLVDDLTNEKYHSQVKELQSNLEGVQERKIVVYHITPEKFKVGLSDEEWQKSETIYKRYKNTNSQPEIVLLGLDGGVKLRAKEFLSNQKLFDTIDAMPMRMQEMRRKNNQ
jgi:hypothetical protein